ncbi:hypothetical protein ACIQXQ_20200 [Peribacillus sp. NPDC097198]|uniref:hypothetical protein n=1 Tax=Peribacillus sp. NPDC097198 TaxID=3364397 RepID=UPI00382AC75A
MKNILVVILIMAPALYFGYEGKDLVMGLSIVAGALTAAFLNLDKFERFSGAGFGAEMRKVEKAVEDAYATIDNLKDIAKPLFNIVISTLTYEGRIGGMEIKEKDKYKENILALSKDLDIYDEKFQQKIDTFNILHIWDAYDEFLKMQFKETQNSDLYNKLYALSDRKTTDFPSEDQLQHLLNGEEISEKANELLHDYLFYQKHKKFS